MSAPQLFYWPNVKDNKAAIAPLQSVGDNMIMRLTSNLPNMPSTPGNTSTIWQYNQIIRSVSFTSEDNLAGMEIIVTGLSAPVETDGQPSGPFEVFSETIDAGPNADTVQTTRIYKRVDQIRTTAPTGINQLSAGYGSFGMFPYIFLNLNQSAPQHWSFSTQSFGAIEDDPVTYDPFVSLNKPDIINTQFGNLTPMRYPLSAFPLSEGGSVPATINFRYSNLDFFANTSFATMFWVLVEMGDTPVWDNETELYLTFVQQGIAQ